MVDAQSLDYQWHVQVPEHGAFHLNPAGPVVRAAAYMLDLLIRFLIIFIVIIVTRVLNADVASGILMLLYFAFEWGWHIAFEGYRNGQTPGKKALGIQVVDTDGRSPRIGAVVIRNFLRVADWLPSGYMLGLVSTMMNKHGRRVGDLCAGTLVVYVNDDTRRKLRLKKSWSEALKESAKENNVLFPTALISSLTPRAVKALTHYAELRLRYTEKRRYEIASRFVAPIARYYSLGNITDPDAFLSALLVHYKEHGALRDGLILGPKASKEQKEELESLEKLCELTEKYRGPEKIFSLASLHRRACARLARLRTFGVAQKELEPLTQGVAAAHHLIHIRERAKFSHFVRMVLRGREAIRRDLHWRIAFVVFFGFFAASAALAYQNINYLEALLGMEMIDQFDQMYEDPLRGRETSQNANMVSFYIMNNVGIALSSFAIGVVGGIGSLFVLSWNGLILGSVFGYMAAHSGVQRAHFFEFVTAHGPFELCGICMCGAAGLRLGWGAISMPGFSWALAFRRSALQALPLLSLGATLVALAAPIEAFISPSALPLIAKQAVGIICAVALFAFLAWPIPKSHTSEERG